jgi:hypothetical protein
MPVRINKSELRSVYSRKKNGQIIGDSNTWVDLNIGSLDFSDTKYIQNSKGQINVIAALMTLSSRSS